MLLAMGTTVDLAAGVFRLSLRSAMALSMAQKLGSKVKNNGSRPERPLQQPH